MTARSCLALAITLVAELPLTAQQGNPGRFETVTALTLDGAPAAIRVVQLAATNRLLLVTRDGGMRLLRLDSATGVLAPMSASVLLPEPSRTALAIDVNGRPGSNGAAGGPSLLAISSRRALEYALDGDHGIGPVPKVLIPRLHFPWRFGQPTFLDFVRDVNGDGRSDLLVPGRGEVIVWIAPMGRGKGVEAAYRPVRIASASEDRRAHRMDELTDELFEETGIRMPLEDDWNGDGRPDHVTRDERFMRCFLVREDGTIPTKPDTELDLERIADDGSPAPRPEPGTILAFDRKEVRIRDLNGDHTPDVVVAHRRKVWVFHSGAKGPNFAEPRQVLAMDEACTNVQLLRCDDDPFPDLLIIRVHVPSLPQILLGLISSLDIETTALAYRNQGNGTFEKDPMRRADLVLRFPALLTLLRSSQDLVQRFEAALARIQPPLLADLDGDNVRDVLLANEDSTRIRVWLRRITAKSDPEPDPERAIRELVFVEQDKVWTFERLIAWLGTRAGSALGRIGEGRAPDAELVLRSKAAAKLVETLSGDLDGDGRAEVLLVYQLRDPRSGTLVPKTVVDLIRLAR